MLRKRFYNIILILAAVVIIFDISYLVTANRYKKVQGPGNSINHYDIYPTNIGTTFANNNSEQTETIGSDADIVFIERNKKTNWDYISSEKKVPQELIGKNKDYIENLYNDEGYKLDSITPEKVVFLKEVDGYNYEKNKYVLGIYDGYIAIYKIDGSGKMYIEDNENDISKIRKVKDFPQDFQEILLKGSSELQFDSKQIAKDYLNGCIS